VRILAPPPETPVRPGAEPSISVIIPCFQAADTVGDAVASALAQTRPAHEVIVCDDGSTDDPAAALEPYRERITLLSKNNGGGASALNHATRVASGDFIAILDADDVYEPRRLEGLGGLASARPDLDILVTDSWIERGGEVVGRYTEQNPFPVDDQRSAIMLACFPGGWPAVRRRRLLAAGGFDESYAIAYDWECWLRLIHGGAVAGLVAEPLMTYRMHAGSLSADPVSSLRERIRMLSSLDRSEMRPREREAQAEALARDRRRLATEELAASLADGASSGALLRLALRRGAQLRTRLGAVRAAVRRAL
jgi:Glycosyl transferase family 2